MATIPTTSTYAAGEFPTAAKLNANGKTALDFLLNSPSGQWRRNAVQSIPNNAWTNITWDTEVFDTDNMLTPSSATITIVTPGLYLVSAAVGFVVNATGARGVQISKNGTAYDNSVGVTTGTAPTKMELATHVRFAAGDTLTVQALQISGGALNTNSASAADQPRVDLKWVCVVIPVDPMTLSGYILAAIMAFGAWRSRRGDVWKSEAEAYRARAERLEKDVADLVSRVERLESENTQLRELATGRAEVADLRAEVRANHAEVMEAIGVGRV